MTASGLCFTPAATLARLIRQKKVSPVEVVRAVLGRIERINPKLNAYCTVVPDLALKAARAADRAVMKRQRIGPLHGVPVSIKDLVPTAGIRTTSGSKIYEHLVPDEDGLVVERLKAAGAIVIGKTNTPEFGAGGNTYNAVFGPTRNPWNPALTCGGSSGGAAVALATGMGPLAQGSDLGGSLRIPAAFCGVVGFRTTPGLVPLYPFQLGWDTYSVQGPMARTVEDTALMLAAIAGPDERVPISRAVDTRAFTKAVKAPSVKGLRVAWSPDLGITPVEKEVSRVAEAATKVFARLGARIEEAAPDLSGIEEIIRVSRGLRMAALHADKLAQWREIMNPDLVWNIEEGLKLTAADVGRAETLRTELWGRVRAFLARYELILTPTVAVRPFPVEVPYPKEIDGKPVPNYIAWVLPTYAFTIVGLPAISVPAGWTADGLPVGLQIAGRWRAEVSVLRAASAFEAAAPWAHRLPPDP